MAKVQVDIIINEELLEEITQLSKENSISRSQMTGQLIEMGMNYLEEVTSLSEEDDLEKVKFNFTIERLLKREVVKSLEDYNMEYKDFVENLIKIGLKYTKNPPKINENSLANITPEQLKSNVGVYSITNIITGRMFITGSKNIKNTLNTVRNELKRGLHRNKMFQNDFNQYGMESFIFEFLRECSEEELESYVKDYKLMNLENIYPLDRGGVNIYHVIKSKLEHSSQGYAWYYNYKENGKTRFLSSINLYILKMKVLEKGLDWVEYDDEAKRLVEEDKEKYMIDGYLSYSRRNKTGIYRVQRKEDKKYNSIYWGYYYYKDKKRKSIQSKNLYELKLKVLKQGLPWKEFTEEAKQLLEIDKEKYLDPNYNKYKNKNGIYRVQKNNHSYKEPAWTYVYKKDNKYKSLTARNLYELKLKVLKEGLEWIEFTEEAKQKVEIAKSEYYGQSTLENYFKN